MEVTVSRRHTEVSDSLRLVRRGEDRPVGPVRRRARARRGPLLGAQEPARSPTRRSARSRSPATATTSGARSRRPTGSSPSTGRATKLEHQLHKLKTKLKRRQPGRSEAPKQPVDVGAAAEARRSAVAVDGGRRARRRRPPRIVKSKRFAMMPMTPEEAAGRMDLLGHGFFFFTNIDTEPGGGGLPARRRRRRPHRRGRLGALRRLGHCVDRPPRCGRGTSLN